MQLVLGVEFSYLEAVVNVHPTVLGDANEEREHGVLQVPKPLRHRLSEQCHSRHPQHE